MKIDSDRDFVFNNIKGNILEIGALAQPYKVNTETNVIYADKYDGNTLKKMCKEHLLGYNDNELDIKDIVCPSVVCDADKLPFDDNTFDAVVTSHILEHLSNPIKAIFEWLRVIKPNGYIYFIVPDKRFTFDEPREVTPVQHIVDDFEQEIEKTAFSHYYDFYINVHKTNIEDARKHYDEQTNIHVHTFTFESIIELIKRYEGVYKIEDAIRNGMNICILLKKE